MDLNMNERFEMSGTDMHLLDTNAIIYFLKGTAPHVKELFSNVQSGSEKLFISVVSKIELLSFQNEQELNDLQTIISAFETLLKNTSKDVK